MTKEEVIEALKLEQKNTDIEMAHSNADDLLCQFLNSLGYSDVTAEYKEIPKWYA